MAILRNKSVEKFQQGGPGIFTQAGTDGLYGGYTKGMGKIGLLYTPGKLGVRGEIESDNRDGSYSRANLDVGGFSGPKGGIGNYFSTGTTMGRHGYGYIGKNKFTGGLGGYGHFGMASLKNDDNSKNVEKAQVGAGIEGRLNFQPRNSNFELFGRAKLGAGYYSERFGIAPGKTTDGAFRPEFGVNAGLRYRF